MCTETRVLTPVDEDLKSVVGCDGLETALLGASVKKVYIW